MDNNYRNIIVIGASAGGLEALIDLVTNLPADLPAAVFVVQHIPSYAPSHLADILNRHTPLQAVKGEPGLVIESGKIYTAVSDCHLLVEEDRILVTKGPKENRFRPSIDTLFRAAAYTFQNRVIGVVLSGALNDGTSGMWMIKRMKGIAIIQDPAEAQFSDMPNSVRQYVEVDYTLPAAEIGALLGRLSSEPMYQVEPEAETDLLALEVDVAKGKNALEMGILDKGTFSPLACPDCHGALTQFEEGELIRFRCHTGHAYTAEALLTSINENIEKNLWQVMRGLEEGNILLQRMGKQLSEAGMSNKARAFFERAKVIQEKAKRMQDAIQEEEMNTEM